MKTNKGKLAISQGDVSVKYLVARAQEAEKQAAAAKKAARRLKAKFKAARAVFKQARKMAKQARKAAKLAAKTAPRSKAAAKAKKGAPPTLAKWQVSKLRNAQAGLPRARSTTNGRPPIPAPQNPARKPTDADSGSGM